MLEAERQGKCWEYSNLLFENSQAMTDENMRLQADQRMLVPSDHQHFPEDRPQGGYYRANQ